MDNFVSVIVPVLHESERINKVIAHLRDLDQNGGLEIIVVDGHHAGSTIKTITDRSVITLCAPAGRASQMNRGARAACGSILLFLHCDTLLPVNGIAAIRDILKSGRCHAGAFALGIDSKRWIFRITERYVAARTRLTRIPFGDQAIFMRREYFNLIGGYREIPLMEDVELMQRIKKRGDRICIIPEKVQTSSRRWDREGIFYCTFRNWVLQLGYAFGVSPRQLVKWYRFK